jgi:L-threonylcarbamoyladenylate synthase
MRPPADSRLSACAAHALLVACGALGVAGVAAPSANRFGRVSPTTAQHVVDEFGPELMVLDGGASRLGIESTIVDCSGEQPVLLRPGVLTRERIEAALGVPLAAPDASSPRAPGTLATHYAPQARLRLMPTEMLRTALQMLGSEPISLAVYSRSVPSGVAVGARHRRMPARPEQAAHELFSVLRELDGEGVHLIWVEEPPSGPEWEGVRDRLVRAAAA